MRIHPESLSILVLLLWLGGYAPPSALAADDAPSPQAMELAVRAGDLSEVQRLIRTGADVNGKLRYGFTPIFHAVDRNYGEIVELLLKHGARLDLVEGFFQTTPLERALDNGHQELALRLLRHPAPGRLDNVLQNPDPDVVRAALKAAGPLYAYQKESALEAARQGDQPDLVQRIEQADERAGWPDLELEPEYLATLAGPYFGRPPESLEWRLSVQAAAEDNAGPRLELRGGEKVWDDWVPVGRRHFRSRSQVTTSLFVLGRGGTLEGLVLTEKGESTMMRRQEDDENDGPARAWTEASPAVPQGPDALGPWASFRGPGGRGVADGLDLVDEWDVETGRNVLWRTSVRGLGLSSPVTDGRRVFLTTAVSADGNSSVELGDYGNPSSVDDESEHSWRVLAYSLKTGELLWQQEAATAAPLSQRHLKSSQANSTPAVGQGIVVVVFPTAGLFAYRADDGKELWHQDLGALPSGPYGGTLEWGFASSPVIFERSVILQVDIHGGAYIAAWDLKTGEMRWRTERDEIPTWSTPLLVPSPTGAELITNGTTARAYDPQTGRELWRIGPGSEVIVASPTFDGRRIFVTSGYPPIKPIYVVRPGARGDLSPTADGSPNKGVWWTQNRGGVYIPTPIAYQGILYLIHGSGRIEALNAADGSRLYRARLSQGGTVSGSPIVADGRIYVPTESGQIYVLKTGDTYEEQSIQELGEAVLTTPAAAEQTLLVRGLDHLYAFGPKPAGAGSSAQAEASESDVSPTGP